MCFYTAPFSRMDRFIVNITRKIPSRDLWTVSDQKITSLIRQYYICMKGSSIVNVAWRDIPTFDLFHRSIITSIQGSYFLILMVTYRASQKCRNLFKALYLRSNNSKYKFAIIFGWRRLVELFLNLTFNNSKKSSLCCHTTGKSCLDCKLALSYI